MEVQCGVLSWLSFGCLILQLLGNQNTSSVARAALGLGVHDGSGGTHSDFMDDEI
jgi:hypothetical protein